MFSTLSMSLPPSPLPNPSRHVLPLPSGIAPHGHRLVFLSIKSSRLALDDLHHGKDVSIFQKHLAFFILPGNRSFLFLSILGVRNVPIFSFSQEPLALFFFFGSACRFSFSGDGRTPARNSRVAFPRSPPKFPRQKTAILPAIPTEPTSSSS